MQRWNIVVGIQTTQNENVGSRADKYGKICKKENKIEVIQTFFTEDVAMGIVKEYGRAKVITMTNVFAHIGTLGEVMRGLARLLDKDGVFMTESQYLLDILERNQFDQVYHEHIRLYSLKSLVTLFPFYGMEVFDVERVTAREGSVRVYVGWRGMHKISKMVSKILRDEERANLFKPAAWSKFRDRVTEQRKRFIDLAHKAKQKGKLFVADSCPGRGTVLLNYYGIDKTLMPYIAQLPGSEKVGKFMPGSHIPIVDNKIIMKEQPDYVVILAWHYAGFIMANWRKKGLKSKFIIPLPEFKIIS